MEKGEKLPTIEQRALGECNYYERWIFEIYCYALRAVKLFGVGYAGKKLSKP